MKLHTRFALILLFAGLAGGALSAAYGAEQPWSQRAANAALERWADGRVTPAGAPLAWTHEQGTLLDGIDAVWLNTVDRRYFEYIMKSVDPLVAADGSLPALKPGENRLVDMQLGRQLMLLYGVTTHRKYFKAATVLYDQLSHQQRTPSGGFWAAQNTPNQMTLDETYEALPFYADYALTYHHPEAFADITKQFVLLQQHTRDAKTGLLHQAWDESKQERWAEKSTGASSQAWGRGMGWYMMALVDTLPNYPENDPGLKQLIAILARDAAAVARYQNAANGLWYEVLDKAGAKGNYPEASASCMFVYALAKGVRLGYLPERYDAVAERGYRGILSHFVTTGPDGSFTLKGTVEPTDLGGTPYHDGSYGFYASQKTIADSPMGVGAFILASTEIENVQNARLGRGKTVMVDAWFNSQKRTDPTGREIYFHYKWDDWSPAGFSLFGHIFHNFGAKTTTLYAAPTVAGLSKAQVFIIASPDNVDKNPHPHYANAQDATQIAAWVKGGGVLVILENDTSFADLDHFNVVAEKYGMHFNSMLRKHVIGTNWAMGKIDLAGNGPIFHHPYTIYVKDVCTISLKPPATPLLKDGSDILMAEAKYGKGTVFAFVDPWLYNEYTDGRKLPAEYQNYAAGEEFVRWILEQVPHEAKPASAAKAAGVMH